MLDRELALGIDIGGTNTVFAIVDSEGNIHFEKSIKTKDFKQPEDLVNEIYNQLQKNSLLQNIIGIGVGAPNGNPFNGNIEFAPNLPWKGIIPLASIIEKKFNKSCKVDNDANIAALGEMKFGVARGLKNFVTITLGTGLGSGIVVDGRVVYGENGFAGEYGHIRVEKEGRVCGCGRKGCLETYVSATGVVRSIREHDSKNQASSILQTIAHPTSLDVVNAAKDGDKFATEILDFTAKTLGESLADFMCFSNPKAFVLFGGLAKIGTSFAENVEKYMNDAALNIYKGKAKVLVSDLHDKNVALLGAAALVFHELKYS
ncbi:MAG: ROK family protein [Crocinitomicaceae bacterium]|nr:ROK family protein [Crocinitomicaceae bacterium]